MTSFPKATSFSKLMETSWPQHGTSAWPCASASWRGSARDLDTTLSPGPGSHQYASPPSADPTVPGRARPGERADPLPCRGAASGPACMDAQLLVVSSALAPVPPAVIWVAPHWTLSVGSCPRPSLSFIPRGPFLPLHGYVQL